VKFWDASAIVPLLVAEASTRRLQAIAARNSGMLCGGDPRSSAFRPWPGSNVTAHSGRGLSFSLKRLRQLSAGWHEIDPSDAVREAAARFLRVHPLRAADALQLAAAFLGSERRPASLELVTLDDRLATAARKEGFTVIDLAPAG